MRVTYILTVLALLTSLTVQNAWAEKTNFVFGVHPFKSQTVLVQMFTPLMEYLGKELGGEVKFKRSRDYESAMNALISGEVDISYLGPAPFAILDAKYPGKIRICAVVVNNGKTTFKGVIAAKEGSGVNSIKDLTGKRFGFGERSSTLSFYMPAYMLMEAQLVDSVDYEFFGTHDKVAAGVLRDKVAAGGLKPAVAEKYLKQGLKIIAESPPVHEHMIVVGPNVSKATYEKITAALISIQDPKVYTSIKRSLTGFAKAQSSDYDNLKEIIQTVDAKFPK